MTNGTVFAVLVVDLAVGTDDTTIIVDSTVVDVDVDAAKSD